MSDFWRLGSMTVTREQHDELVAKRGRNLTDFPMREAQSYDIDDTSASVVDRVIGEARAGARTK